MSQHHRTHSSPKKPATKSNLLKRYVPLLIQSVRYMETSWLGKKEESLKGAGNGRRPIER